MGALVGAALGTAGLALNPLALAYFLPQQAFSIHGIIAVQILLFGSGGWLCWRQPSLPPLSAVGVAMLGGLSAFGFYGTIGSLQAVQERREQLSALDRSEELQQDLSAEVLPLLAAGFHQQSLPVEAGRTLFADSVEVVDLAAHATPTALELAIEDQHCRWQRPPATALNTSRYGDRCSPRWQRSSMRHSTLRQGDSPMPESVPTRRVCASTRWPTPQQTPGRRSTPGCTSAGAWRQTPSGASIAGLPKS